MEILILAFLAFAAFVGLAPKELTQVVLVGMWSAMAVCAAGAVLWSVGSLLL